MIHISDVSTVAWASYRHHSIVSDDGMNSCVFSYKYLLDEPDTAVKIVGFMGTDSLDDWILTNAMLFKKQIKHPNQADQFELGDGYGVHMGFLRSYRSLRRLIFEKIEGNQKVIFTGHSLGGALASIAAVDYKVIFPDSDIRLVTFGAPRVGNKNLKEAARDVLGLRNCYRVVKIFDPVQFTPIIGYHHWDANIIRLVNLNILESHDMGDYHNRCKKLKVNFFVK